jgi:hypothetical protein
MRYLVLLALLVFCYSFARPIFWIILVSEILYLAYRLLNLGWVKICWFFDNWARIRMRYNKQERRYKFYLANAGN